jgi:hypothetical protein
VTRGDAVSDYRRHTRARERVYCGIRVTARHPPCGAAPLNRGGINNLDQIVGLANPNSFLYSNGTYTSLAGQAFGINDLGQIVGFSDVFPPTHPLEFPAPSPLKLSSAGRPRHAI